MRVCAAIWVLLNAAVCQLALAKNAEEKFPGDVQWKLPDVSALSKSQEGRLYDEAVHILGGNANVVAKWVTDIRYAIIGDTAAGAAQFAHKTLEQVIALAGLAGTRIDHQYRNTEEYRQAVAESPPFELSACSPIATEQRHPICANFVVFIGSQAAMENLAAALPLRRLYQKALQQSPTIACFFAPFVNGSMVIGRVFIFISNELTPDMQRTCLQEEIYQSFGLFNDFTGSDYFSFNNVVEPKSITEHDKALLQSLYADGIKPGTPVFTVINEWMAKLGIKPFNR